MTAGYDLSTSPPLSSRKTQKKAKKTSGETQGNQLDFRIALVC